MPTILNTIELNLSCLQPCIFKFTSSDQIKQLREAYPILNFYKFRGIFYCWGDEEQLSKLPFIIEKASDYEITPSVIKKVIEVSIYSFFKNNGYDCYVDKYSSVTCIPLKKEKKINLNGLYIEPYTSVGIHFFSSSNHDFPKFFISFTSLYKHFFDIDEISKDNLMLDLRAMDKNESGQIVATKRNIDTFLKATAQESRYKEYTNKIYSNQFEYENFIRYYKSFEKILQKLPLPQGISISKLSLSALPNINFSLEQMRKPQYFFYNEKESQIKFYNESVKVLKPFSYDSFKDAVKIAVISPKEYEGSSGQLVRKVKGILQQTFHLKIDDIPILTCENNIDGYKNVIKEIDSDNLDLVIIIVSEVDKKLSINDSPYYLTKAKLLNLGIPTQDVTIEKIKNSNIYIENNISLNIYSKLGGTAWTIEKCEKNIPELIIGVGSTLDKQLNRIVGFANIFDHNGTYLVGSCKPYSSYENYGPDMEQYLVDSLKDIIEFKQIDKKQQIRLIFHLYKDASYKTEINAIKNALDKYPDYSFQYSLVHLSYGHNFRLFSNNGTTDVYRGTYVPLDKYTALLHFGSGSKAPVLIKVDPRSSYRDLYEISRQVMYFSHLSHRSFYKLSTVPVTIKYPKLMAKMTSELQCISNWDYDQLSKLNEKLWFI